MRRFAFIFLLLGFAGAQDDLLYQQGLEVYKSYYCGLCHSSSAAGTKGIFGPPHEAMAVIAPARIADPAYQGDAENAEAYLIESVLEPERYVVPGFALARHRMPAYTHMKEEELNALIYFLLYQEGAMP